MYFTISNVDNMESTALNVDRIHIGSLLTPPHPPNPDHGNVPCIVIILDVLL